MLFLRFINRLVYNENDYDIELDDWAAPDANVSRKMVAQIEHYLSDDNLVKDTFLLKHVRRNKMGYVNVKLLTSFKKVRCFIFLLYIIHIIVSSLIVLDQFKIVTFFTLYELCFLYITL